MQLKVQEVRIDAHLIECALQHGKHASAVEVIEAALREYIVARIGSWDDLIGKVEYYEGCDWRTLRGKKKENE